MKKDIVIIGGGPAGLAAAVGAYEAGARDILILERDVRLGGILNQCIHNGFGLHAFGEELTGPEYADRYIKEVEKRKIPYVTGAMVLSVTPDRTVTYVTDHSVIELNAGAVILACGCRERPRGAINIPGTRPAGVFSAGTAQRLMNIDGYKIGERAVILGSGDIGLIMARRLTFEGAKVEAVVELMPYSSGLKRNVVQCLDDFGIPLLFSHTVVDIKGRDRVEGVTVAAVDKDLSPIPGTEKYFDCDTLLLSVGLLPENELLSYTSAERSKVTGGAVVDENMSTDIEGIFECGNVLHVHDLVDFVSEESLRAGASAAAFVVSARSLAAAEKAAKVEIVTDGRIRYTVPQRLISNGKGELTLRMRVNGVYKNAEIVIEADGKKVLSKKRIIVAPGEMETLILKEDKASALRSAERVSVSLKGERML